MSTLITYYILGVGVEFAHGTLSALEPGIGPQISGKGYFSGKYHVKFGHFVRFS